MEFGHNGCNTRDDILRRDLDELVVRPDTCYARSGVLFDPYTGASIPFVRGPDTSDAVQIDHVVSLSDAWYKGARAWNDQRRRDFANDPRNLLAVGGKANFDKAFRDAASWLPPNAAFGCEFAARQVDVNSDLITAKLETAPRDATHWSTGSMAEHLGLSQSMVSRVWRAFGLVPHKQDSWKLADEFTRHAVALFVDTEGAHHNDRYREVSEG